MGTILLPRPIVAKCFPRAITIIGKEMKEGAPMMQLSVIDALSVMVLAIELVALVQNFLNFRGWTEVQRQVAACRSPPD